MPASGKYTFRCHVGWGQARLLVNGTPIAAKDWGPWIPDLTATVQLAPGPANITVELYKYGTDCCTAATLYWQPPGSTEQPMPPEAWAAPGVACHYYAITNTSPIMPTSVPDFTGWMAFYSDVVPDLYFALNAPPAFTGVLGTDTGVRFDGFLLVPATGQYTFNMQVISGAKMFIDETQVLDANSGTGNGSMTLAAGAHRLRVDAYHVAFDHMLIVEMEGPGVSRQTIPANAFVHGELLPLVPADFNQDGHVDASDLAILQTCTSGPAVAHTGTPACQAADLDHDTDVDQADFGVFQQCFSGPNAAPPVNCGM